MALAAPPMTRPCKFCGKEVDFSEPWCDHETMEESAWIDIHQRIVRDAQNMVIDELVKQAAKDLIPVA
jgi:hypothetical protein